MRFPSKLKPGDKIGIIATARKVKKPLEGCYEILQSWGLEIVEGNHLYEGDNQYAGTDSARREDLQEMLERDDIKAILCARGGYGTLRIIDEIRLDKITTPKWLVGFSDVTALLIAGYNHGIATIHGPMGISFDDGKTGNPEAIAHLKNVLMGSESITLQAPAERPDLSRTGLAKGQLIGGNLTMLVNMIGTKTDFNTDGCVLFLEDLDEYLYHIDRMIVHMKRAGKFGKLAGLVIGGFTDLKDNDTPFGKTAEEIVYDAVKSYDFPICYGFPVGHWQQNFPLVVGAQAELRVTHSQVELTF